MATLNPDAIAALQAELAKPAYSGKSPGQIAALLNADSEEFEEEGAIVVRDVIKTLLTDGRLIELALSPRAEERVAYELLMALIDEALPAASLEPILALSGVFSVAQREKIRGLKNQKRRRSPASRILGHSVDSDMIEDALE